MPGVEDACRDDFDWTVRAEVGAKIEEAEDRDACRSDRNEDNSSGAARGHRCADYRVRSTSGEPRWQSFNNREQPATIFCSDRSRKSTPKSPMPSRSRPSVRAKRPE